MNILVRLALFFTVGLLVLYWAEPETWYGVMLGSALSGVAAYMIFITSDPPGKPSRVAIAIEISAFLGFVLSVPGAGIALLFDVQPSHAFLGAAAAQLLLVGVVLISDAVTRHISSPTT